MQPQMLKKVLLHLYWLIFSLSAIVFFFFLPNRGALEYSVLLTGFILFLHLANRRYRIKDMPKYYLLIIIFCGILLLSSILFSFSHTDTHRMFRVLKMLIILFAVHYVGRQNLHKEIEIASITILTSLILFQFIDRTFLGKPFGSYSNPHYLAELACLTLPFIFYYCWTAPKMYKGLFIVLGMLDLDLLLRTSSRPAILALCVSLLFVILFLVRGRRRWIGLMTVVFVAVALYLTRYAGVVGRIDELIAHLSSEERVQFWSDTWKMLQHNSLGAWIIGNGIGSFPDFFPAYSIPEYNFFSFPHNHVLQILFDNGLVGVVVVLFWQLYPLYVLVKSSSRTTDPTLRVFINCVCVAYLTSGIFTSLTVGFYSRYSLYPFAFLLGTIMIIAEKVLARNGATFMLKSKSFPFYQEGQGVTGNV